MYKVMFNLPQPASYETYLGHGYYLGLEPTHNSDGTVGVTLSWLQQTPLFCAKPNETLTDSDKRAVRVLNYLLVGKPTWLLRLLRSDAMAALKERINIRLDIDKVARATADGDTWQEAVDMAWAVAKDTIKLDRQLRQTRLAVWNLRDPLVVKGGEATEYN